MYIYIPRKIEMSAYMIFVSLSTIINISIYLSLLIFMSVCVYLFQPIHIHIYVCLCITISAYSYSYVCLSVYLFQPIHIHICFDFGNHISCWHHLTGHIGYHSVVPCDWLNETEMYWETRGQLTKCHRSNSVITSPPTPAPLSLSLRQQIELK